MRRLMFFGSFGCYLLQMSPNVFQVVVEELSVGSIARSDSNDAVRNTAVKIEDSGRTNCCGNAKTRSINSTLSIPIPASACR
jgi:hypothetical protein